MTMGTEMMSSLTIVGKKGGPEFLGISINRLRAWAIARKMAF